MIIKNDINPNLERIWEQWENQEKVTQILNDLEKYEKVPKILHYKWIDLQIKLKEG